MYRRVSVLVYPEHDIKLLLFKYKIKIKNMNAYIKWPNGHTTRVGAYYNESINTFETRVLKSYGKYDCRILLSVRTGEGFYIK